MWPQVDTQDKQATAMSEVQELFGEVTMVLEKLLKPKYGSDRDKKEQQQWVRDIKRRYGVELW
jgi:hypothetical protein